MNNTIIQQIPTIYKQVLQKIQNFTVTLSDGYQTPLFHIPSGDKKLTKTPIAMMHGIQSHPGWFLDSADFLSKQGYPVFLLTRRGSGFNTVNRGHAQGPSQLFNDLDRSIASVLELSGAAKVHLVGISWGGKLLPCYCIKRLKADFVSSLSIISPGIFSQVDVSPYKKLKIAVSLLFYPQKKFDIPLNEPEFFTDNRQAREFIKNDPQRLHQATARFMYTSRQLDKIISAARSGQLKIPCNLILASRDRIIDNEKTKCVIDRISGKQARVFVLDGAHTLEFEPDPREFHRILLECVGK